MIHFDLPSLRALSPLFQLQPQQVCLWAAGGYRGVPVSLVEGLATFVECADKFVTFGLVEAVLGQAVF